MYDSQVDKSQRFLNDIFKQFGFAERIKSPAWKEIPAKVPFYLSSVHVPIRKRLHNEP
jgi:hypothetical protein